MPNLPPRTKISRSGPKKIKKMGRIKRTKILKSFGPLVPDRPPRMNAYLELNWVELNEKNIEKFLVLLCPIGHLEPKI